MRAAMVSVLFVSATAAAQPVMRPDVPCAVTVVRAPEDVRATIEAWVKAEPRCRGRLEVRVFTVDGGLDLIAIDEQGRLRERVVPDAQSAAVLVASWIADDGYVVGSAPSAMTMAPTPAPEPPPAAPPPDAAPVIASAAPTPMPDGVPAMMPPGQVDVMPVVARERAPKWIALGGTFGMSDGGSWGLRGELDLRSRGRLSLGLAGSLSESTLMLGGAGSGYLDVLDAKVVVFAGVSAACGGWRVRSSIAAGVVATEAQIRDSSGTDTARGVFPVGEASIVVTRELGKSWGIEVGPVAAMFAQDFRTAEMGSFVTRRALDLGMFLGVRHRL